MSNKKIEFSKLIIFVSGIIFTTTVMACIGIFVYCTMNRAGFDWTGIVTLLTVTGGAFTTAFAAYEKKARIENIYKIKKSFLKEKYTVLKRMGALNYNYASQEIMNEVQAMDTKLDTEEENISLESDTNFNI